MLKSDLSAAIGNLGSGGLPRFVTLTDLRAGALSLDEGILAMLIFIHLSWAIQTK